MEGFAVRAKGKTDVTSNEEVGGVNMRIAVGAKESGVGRTVERRLLLMAEITQCRC